MTLARRVEEGAAWTADIRSHILARIAEASTGVRPFHHIFVENIFPDPVYSMLRAHMVRCKYGDDVLDRPQDNPAYTNKRYSLVESSEGIVESIRTVFSNADVKERLLERFYISPSQELVESLTIHEEFEYVFTRTGRFQNIHVDIPPKFLSFVFYIPERAVPPAEAERNATILYDKSLTPHYAARFVPNSVCVFAPHFSSYHGFSSTIDRDVLVMFYVNRDALREWQTMRREMKDTPPFTGLLDTIETKLRVHPLIEFGDDDRRLAEERSSCLVNAPQGRVRL